MLFSEITVGVVEALGTVVVTLMTAGGAFYALWNKISKEKRDAVLEENQKTILRQDQEIVGMRGRMDELTTRVFKLQDDVYQCREREASQKIETAGIKAELQAAYVRIRALESVTGSQPALVTTVGVVVANLKGRIRVFSPSLTPLLQWLPKEIEGKSVELLIPPELLEKAREALARIAAAGTGAIDQGRVILTQALTKQGGRVPISLVFSGWGADGEGLVTAEIRQRPADSTEARSGVLTKGGTLQAPSSPDPVDPSSIL